MALCLAQGTARAAEDESPDAVAETAASGATSDEDATSVGATTEAARPSEAPSEATNEDFGHIGQFGLRAGLVLGYRMIFRYADSPFCAEPDPVKGGFKDQQVFCGHAAPLATDVALSFALLDALEVYGFGRFGFTGEEQTDTHPVRAFGVGARFYTMSDAKMKVFVQPAVGMSFEGGGDDPRWQNFQGTFEPSYESDLLFQLAVGPQYDFNRYFGLYASGGVTVGVLRAMSANLEGTIGLQGRAP